MGKVLKEYVEIRCKDKDTVRRIKDNIKKIMEKYDYDEKEYVPEIAKKSLKKSRSKIEKYMDYIKNRKFGIDTNIKNTNACISVKGEKERSKHLLYCMDVWMYVYEMRYFGIMDEDYKIQDFWREFMGYYVGKKDFFEE